MVSHVKFPLYAEIDDAKARPHEEGDYDSDKIVVMSSSIKEKRSRGVRSALQTSPDRIVYHNAVL